MIHYQDEEITRVIISAAIEVHKILGPGLLESVYKKCLLMELSEKELKYKEEMIVPLVYKNKRIDEGFRIDILVEDRVVMELKSVEQILPVHEAQMLTYMRLLDKQVGLLINFNVPILKQGIRRCVLNAYDEEVEEPDWVLF
jgi:GxxExxY protein